MFLILNFVMLKVFKIKKLGEKKTKIKHYTLTRYIHGRGGGPRKLARMRKRERLYQLMSTLTLSHGACRTIN
jgi:hypothetical protein